MNTTKIVSGVLLFVGVFVLVLGYHAYHSVNSDVSRLLTGTASNKSIWLLISGSVASIIGVFGMMKK
jgi:hypothetical protein